MEDFKKKGHSHQKPTQENPRVNNFAERRFQGIIKQMRLDNSKFLRQANLGLFDHNSLVRHLEIAEEYSGDTSRKSLSQKNTGKFYTPPEIALPLIEQVLKILNLNTKNGMVSIIDPFCGDGRLLRWLIAKIDNHNLALDIHLWDYDQESVSRAHSEVLKAAQGCNAKIKVFSKQTDSFSEFFKGYQEKFDLVI